MANVIVRPKDVYYNWLVIEEIKPIVSESGKKDRYVRAQCACGHIQTIRLSSIRHNETKRCKLCDIKSRTLFTPEERPLLKIYDGMQRRCYDATNHAYPRYGGRGIKIAKVWQKRKAFLKWALDNGYKKGLTIDRIDNDGDYEPTNCRFVTRSYNSRWKSTTLLNWDIVWDIRNTKALIPEITKREIAEAFGVSYYSVWNILANRSWVSRVQKRSVQRTANVRITEQ